MLLILAGFYALLDWKGWRRWAFPLVVAASTLTGRRPVELVVLGLSAFAMVGYAMLAFLGMVVP